MSTNPDHFSFDDEPAKPAKPKHTDNITPKEKPQPQGRPAPAEERRQNGGAGGIGNC